MRLAWDFHDMSVVEFCGNIKLAARIRLAKSRGIWFNKSHVGYSRL